jgi:predicted nucleic acid-binding protein
VDYSHDREGDEEGLTNVLRGVTLLGLDTSLTTLFGRERGRLRAAGTLIGDFDVRIAATALHHTLTLLTNNRRHDDSLECIQKTVEGMTGERVLSRLENQWHQ